MLYTQTAARHMDEGVLFYTGNVTILYSSVPPGINNHVVALYFYNSWIWLEYFRKGKVSTFYRGPLRPSKWALTTKHQGLYSWVIAGTDVSLMTIARCTATRPSALVREKPLLYSDIEFLVFPSSVKGQRSRILMKLNLRNIKRSGWKSRPYVVSAGARRDRLSDTRKSSHLWRTTSRIVLSCLY